MCLTQNVSEQAGRRTCLCKLGLPCTAKHIHIQYTQSGADLCLASLYASCGRPNDACSMQETEACKRQMGARDRACKRQKGAHGSMDVRLMPTSIAVPLSKCTQTPHPAFYIQQSHDTPCCLPHVPNTLACLSHIACLHHVPNTLACPSHVAYQHHVRNTCADIFACASKAGVMGQGQEGRVHVWTGESPSCPAKSARARLGARLHAP